MPALTRDAAVPAAVDGSPQRVDRPSRLLLHALPLLLYAGAALALTWPLVTLFATHVPGDGIDDPALAWNLWWVSDRLVNQLNADIFTVGWMFHPVTINLAFYTLTPLQGLLSTPLQVAAGLVIANNLVLLSSFVLGGYGTYLLVISLLAPLHARAAHSSPSGGKALWIAALLAGFLYAFAAPKLFYVALGQFNIAASQWIPFAALYAVRLLRSRQPASSLGDGFMLGLFFVLQAWSELTYASFLLLFLAGCFLFALLDRSTRRRMQSVVIGFSVSAAVAMIGLAPILMAMLPDLRAEGDFFASGGGFADVFSADLAGYLFPTRLHPVAGDFAAALPFANDKGQQIFLGYTAVGLAVLGFFWLWRRARGQAIFWALATLGFWLLSLGPSMRWMGRDLGISGPFSLVSQLPFFSGNRYPSRYSVMVILCVAVLAAAGLLALISWLERRSVRRASLWAGALVGALLLAEHTSKPLPMSDMRVPGVYQRLADEPDDRALLELPTGWRNGARVIGYSDELIMRQQWWQSVHGKRRLGGNTSRNPAHKFQYYSESLLLSDLIAMMNADRNRDNPQFAGAIATMLASHRLSAGQDLEDLGVGYVSVHVEHATPELLRFVAEVLPLELIEEWRGSEPDGTPATIRLYRVTSSKVEDDVPQVRSIDPSLPSSRHFLAEGWSSVAATTLHAIRPQAHLLLPLPDEGGSLRIFADQAPTGLQLNGRPWPGEWEGEAIHVEFGPGAAAELMDRVAIRWPSDGTSVTELALVPSEVGTSGLTLPAGVTLAAVSAGEEVGDFAELWVSGVNVAADLPQRGFLLAAVQPTGAFLDAASFDTHADPSASALLSSWVDQWPQGTVILGAVADEASRLLGDDAIAALESLGDAAGMNGCFRCSHAFVGVVGAAPASAISSLDLVRPASVWLGAAVTAPMSYAAIERIEWESATGGLHLLQVARGVDAGK